MDTTIDPLKLTLQDAQRTCERLLNAWQVAAKALERLEPEEREAFRILLVRVANP